MFPDGKRPDYDTVAKGDELRLSLMNKEQLLIEHILTQVFWVEEFPLLDKKVVHGTRTLQDGTYEMVLELYRRFPERDTAYEQRVIPVFQM